MAGLPPSRAKWLGAAVLFALGGLVGLILVGADGLGGGAFRLEGEVSSLFRPSRPPQEARRVGHDAIEQPSGREPKANDPLPRLALIIDDLGYGRKQAKVISGLPFPIACAVLPDAPYAQEVARRAFRHGKEVLAHIPMEPRNPNIALTDDFLRRDMAYPLFRRTLERELQGIPYIVGVNNHMGSFLTSYQEPMRWVMEILKRKGLFFIDSRTTAATQGLATARRVGIPAAERDVFLDHERGEAVIRHHFQRLLQTAQRQGTAIGIGHPYPETVRVLRDLLPWAAEHGHRIVPVREVITARLQARDNEDGGNL